MNKIAPRIAKNSPKIQKSPNSKIKTLEIEGKIVGRGKRLGKQTVSSVAADAIDGHEESEDDAEGAEDEEGEGEGDLLDGRLGVDGVRGFHHYVLVADRERMVYVRHFSFGFWVFKVFDESSS